MSKEIIRLENVGFQAGDHEILTNINFTVEEGQLVMVTGPSGGGKSTLLKLIGLLNSPTTGSIQYQGKNIFEYEPTEYRKEVSYFFQNAVLFDDTVENS